MITNINPIEDIRSLSIFVQVAKDGSFAAAARSQGLTPPAISKSIAKLERQLGARLFNRTTRHVALTTEGRLFLNKVTEGLSVLEDAISEIGDTRREPAGVVRVFMSASFGKHCVLPLLSQFFSAYPKIDLDIFLSDDVPQLVSSGFDVGIHYKDINEAKSNLVSRQLCTLPLTLVASPSYLARKGAPQTPEDLDRHEWIHIRLPGGDTPEWEFWPQPSARRPAGTPFRVQAPAGRINISGELDGAFNAVLCGFGLMVMPLRYVQPWLQVGALRQLLADWRIEVRAEQESEIFIIYPHRKYLALKTRALVDFLFKHFGAGQAG